MLYPSGFWKLSVPAVRLFSHKVLRTHRFRLHKIRKATIFLALTRVQAEAVMATRLHMFIRADCPADNPIRVDSGEWAAENEESTRRPLTMSSLARALRLPANESYKNIVLVLCVISLSALSIALVWQAQVIANQREAIQWLEKLKFGM